MDIAHTSAGLQFWTGWASDSSSLVSSAHAMSADLLGCNVPYCTIRRASWQLGMHKPSITAIFCSVTRRVPSNYFQILVSTGLLITQLEQLLVQR